MCACVYIYIYIYMLYKELHCLQIKIILYAKVSDLLQVCVTILFYFIFLFLKKRKEKMT